MNIQYWVRMYAKSFIRIVFILSAAVIVFAGAGPVNPVAASGQDEAVMATDKPVPDVEHPMMKPKMYSEAMQCPNCGMMINMWARTRHAFHHEEGDLTTCSIRCMADKAVNSGSEPANAQVALYLDPDTMVPVEKAVYVVGSTAAGTMTMKSKIAFADKASAEAFTAEYGGDVMDFQGAYEAAKAELPKSRISIDEKRKKTGKIKEPTPEDSCAVCGMRPAMFPNHNAQILTKNGDTVHFCSTQCMTAYNADPAKYAKEPAPTNLAWVKLFSDGMYESAFGAYYVVGSKVDGPMGKEAIPFKVKKDAEDFAKENGGQVVMYPQLTPELITGN